MPDKPSPAEYRKLEPWAAIEIPGGKLTLPLPNEHVRGRIMTLKTKEPDTLAWLQTFSSDDIFYDIGANIGLYGIVATALRQCRVYAFEPEAQNFALLNRFIAYNHLADRVTAFSLALSDGFSLDYLHLNSVTAGFSHHSFGAEVDHNLQPRVFPCRQGSVAMALDAVIASGLPQPTRIKIDVDGLEHKVVAGARQALANPALKSCLVEINTNLPEHLAIIDMMVEWGFVYDRDQADQHRRRSGPNAGVGNFIFHRSPQTGD